MPSPQVLDEIGVDTAMMLPGARKAAAAKASTSQAQAEEPTDEEADDLLQRLAALRQ